MLKQLWVDKYRPNSTKNYVFENDTHKQFILGVIKNNTLPNLLLSGQRGTGKTSLVNVLKNELKIDDDDFLSQNSSNYTSIDNVRNSILPFTETLPHGDFKVVFLDEAENLSQAAQTALQCIIEQSSDNVRFIFSCNKAHKLKIELHSRLHELTFKGTDKDAMILQAGMILSKEKINAKLDVLEYYLENCYPDFRKFIITLENNVEDGKLVKREQLDSTLELKFELSELMQNDKWDDVRMHLCGKVSNDDWESIYRFLYDYLHEVGKFKDLNKWKMGIVIIADALYRHSFVTDPEINAAAMFIKLSNV